MRKVVYYVVVASVLVACGGNQKKEEATTVVESKALQSKNTNAFNQSFENLLTAYDNLKNGFVEYDTAAIRASTMQLAYTADSLAIHEIQGDTTGAIKMTAQSYSTSISQSAAAILASKDLEGQKRQFQAISDALYELARTVRYDQAKLYHQRCPMAFNDDEEAFWLSKSDEIINPYLGKKHTKYKAGMLHCGDIADSLNFVQR